MNLFWLHTRLLIVAIIWGLGWTAGRVVATDFPPLQQLGFATSSL